MIRIAITIEAFEAIARTLPFGSVSYETEANERGERTVRLEEVWVNRLSAMRGPTESYSDVILRMGREGRPVLNAVINSLLQQRGTSANVSDRKAGLGRYGRARAGRMIKEAEPPKAFHDCVGLDDGWRNGPSSSN